MLSHYKKFIKSWDVNIYMNKDLGSEAINNYEFKEFESSIKKNREDSFMSKYKLFLSERDQGEYKCYSFYSNGVAGTMTFFKPPRGEFGVKANISIDSVNNHKSSPSNEGRR